MTNIDSKSENFSWLDLIKALWYFLQEDRKKYIFYSFVLLIIYSYPFLLTFLVGKIAQFFLHYKVDESLRNFYILIVVTCTSYILVSIVRLFAKRALVFIATDVVYRTKVEGFERLMDFSLTWHQGENTGNKVQRIQTGATQLKGFMDSLLSKLFDVFVSFIGVIGIFLFLDLSFLAFILAYIISFFVVEWYFYNKIKHANDKFNEFNEKSSGTYYESASNVLTIKTLGVKDSVKSNVTNNENLAREHSKKIGIYGFRKWQFFQTISGLALGLFLLMVGNSVIRGDLAVEFVLVYFAYFERLRNAVQTSSELVTILIEQKSGVARMMPIFWDKDQQKEGKKQFPSSWSSISIVDGEFSYKVKNDSFKVSNLNIEINRYEKIGIIGHSGSGKSTFAKLLLGVYELESGKFRIGNEDYYAIKHSELSRNISTVLQETELFNLTFKENITMMKELNVDLFDKVIRIAQLEEVISKLPNGIESLIGEKGYKLSGGERQRLGIARAIYSNSEVLILDEATSALDSKTESLIQNAIESELTKKTLIIIAHRLSTLKNVDRIYVFEKGKIVEEGNFDDLLENKDSRFAEMYRLQNRKN